MLNLTAGNSRQLASMVQVRAWRCVESVCVCVGGGGAHVCVYVRVGVGVGVGVCLAGRVHVLVPVATTTATAPYQTCGLVVRITCTPYTRPYTHTRPSPPAVPPYHKACPDALLDDGLLDVTYVTGGAAAGATSLVSERWRWREGGCAAASSDGGAGAADGGGTARRGCLRHPLGLQLFPRTSHDSRTDLSTPTASPPPIPGLGDDPLPLGTHFAGNI